MELGGDPTGNGYAANRQERTVNFGILITYRQKWEPLGYQAGRLVKSAGGRSANQTILCNSRRALMTGTWLAETMTCAIAGGADRGTPAGRYRRLRSPASSRPVPGVLVPDRDR